MPWFSQKMSEGERLKYLRYLQDEYALASFRGREADRYDSVIIKYFSKSVLTVGMKEKMYRATKRLALACDELIRRRSSIHVSGLGDKCFLAWLNADFDWATWAHAQLRVSEMLLAGLEPTLNIHAIKAKADASKQKALIELEKLVRRLQLTPEEMADITNQAQSAIETDKWRPKIPIV